MKFSARGYIASGEFNGYRVPQHLQNQIVKSYCEAHNFQFIVSRAEYWINGSTKSQLWAALKEGFKHIVFFSLWQLPNEIADRRQIYDYCLDNEITLHFATERIKTSQLEICFIDLEILIQSNLLILENSSYDTYFDVLKKLL